MKSRLLKEIKTIREKCFQIVYFSTRYCYMGKVIKAVRSGRPKQKNDDSKFLELIGKLHKHINWFSISSAFVKGEF